MLTSFSSSPEYRNAYMNFTYHVMHILCKPCNCLTCTYLACNLRRTDRRTTRRQQEKQEQTLFKLPCLRPLSRGSRGTLPSPSLSVLYVYMCVACIIGHTLYHRLTISVLALSVHIHVLYSPFRRLQVCTIEVQHLMIVSSSSSIRGIIIIIIIIIIIFTFTLAPIGIVGTDERLPPAGGRPAFW